MLTTINKTTTQVAVLMGQLLTDDSIPRFLEEVEKSAFSKSVKDFIRREFYPNCNIPETIKYMKGYHVSDVRIAGYSFDWVLKSREAV